MPHADPEKRREYARLYARKQRARPDHKEKPPPPGYHRAWADRNRVKLSAYKRRWYAEQMSRNPAFQLKRNLYSRIRIALLGIAKSKKTAELLGCSLEYFSGWLEAQFKPGMSWENYGQGWHVDHRKPCASFDLSDPAQQQICFHYTNLQPLWAIENLQKGAKV